jgi:hypothetical protein
MNRLKDKRIGALAAGVLALGFSVMYVYTAWVLSNVYTGGEYREVDGLNELGHSINYILYGGLTLLLLIVCAILQGKPMIRLWWGPEHNLTDRERRAGRLFAGPAIVAGLALAWQAITMLSFRQRDFVQEAVAAGLVGLYVVWHLVVIWLLGREERKGRLERGIGAIRS